MTVAEQLCDRVAFVNDGKIIVEDAPKNLMIQYGKRTVKIEYNINNKLFEKEFEIVGLADNGEFTHLLKSADIKTIHSAEATLEDVFIKLTGRNLL